MQEQTKYQIGEFSFSTFHEYRDGQEDVRKIECINKELNIQDPEVAVRLYNDIRSGKIEFKTAIGDQFFAHLGDIVADKSVDLLEDKAVVEEAEGKMKYQKIIGLAFIVLAIVSFSVFGVAELRDVITTRRMQKLANEMQTEQPKKPEKQDSKPEKTAESKKDSEENKGEPEQQQALTPLPEYSDLLQQNQDLVGWITIDDTQINYPVVQKNKDNEYYLNHAFDQSSNANGTIFVDYRSNIANPTTNTIVYGHNMKSGMMFGGLKNYLSEGYLESHKLIHFNTIYEYHTYEIVAVCLSQVQYQDEDDYRYYDFISANSDQDWKNFVVNVNKLAVYGDVNSLSKEDKLLTLSTCNSYTEDGRLFVVAKQVE